MSHAQKPYFVFRRNGRVHLNRQGPQFSRLLAAEVCASAFTVGSNAVYTMFRGRVKSSGYPLHSPISPSLTLPCVTVCHDISTGLYLKRNKFFPRTQHRIRRHLFGNSKTNIQRNKKRGNLTKAMSQGERCCHFYWFLLLLPDTLAGINGEWDMSQTKHKSK
jgi:hypothetical protein